MHVNIFFKLSVCRSAPISLLLVSVEIKYIELFFDQVDCTYYKLTTRTITICAQYLLPASYYQCL